MSFCIHAHQEDFGNWCLELALSKFSIRWVILWLYEAVEQDWTLRTQATSKKLLGTSP